MTVIVKSKTELVVPRSVRRRAGIKTGDHVEFKVSGGVINIIPKLPSADDEYTPAQRRIIDARLKEALAEVKKGSTAGPFNTADEMIASLKRELKRAPGKKPNPALDEGRLQQPKSCCGADSSPCKRGERRS
jgi:bifunctional DNA-binding transcriptional regulator/antitoxin component of YhaV-PrlF toxin-antitoxin module